MEETSNGIFRVARFFSHLSQMLFCYVVQLSVFTYGPKRPKRSRLFPHYVSKLNSFYLMHFINLQDYFMGMCKYLYVNYFLFMFKGRNMTKVLIVAATANMIMQFNMRNIDMLQNMGYEVHVASNFMKCESIDQREMTNVIKSLEEKKVIWHHIDFERGFGTFSSNRRALIQLEEILQDSENWDFVHTHSPLGGALGRIAAKKMGIRTIYTAHGFHFSKGGSLKNWTIFPIEFILSFFTNELVVINKHDYKLAKKYFRTHINYLPSVGTQVLDRMSVSSVERLKNKARIRRELNLSPNAFVFVSSGELNDNKNHGRIIEAMEYLPDHVHLLIAGVGQNYEKYQNQIKNLKLDKRIKLLGYRRDLQEIHHACDAFIFPSLREGLGMSGINALVDGLYVIGSETTNMCDYISNDDLGVLINPRSMEKIYTSMDRIVKNSVRPDLEKHLKKLSAFDTENVDATMLEIYKRQSSY